LGFDAFSGFLIIHSIPNFIDIQEGKIVLEISSSQRIYGQHIFCIHMADHTIEEYAKMLLIDRPYIYADSSIPIAL